MSIATLAIGGALACRGDTPGQGGGPSAQAESVEPVERVAEAWCRHHASCSRIAPGKDWPDFEACRAETRDRLTRAHRCGIDPTRAQACVSALDDKECDAFMVRAPKQCGLCD